jgi:hypothetical protein
MTRTKQNAKASAGGKSPRTQLARKQQRATRINFVPTRPGNSAASEKTLAVPAMGISIGEGSGTRHESLNTSFERSIQSSSTLHNWSMLEELFCPVVRRSALYTTTLFSIIDFQVRCSGCSSFGCLSQCPICGAMFCVSDDIESTTACAILPQRIQQGTPTNPYKTQLRLICASCLDRHHLPHPVSYCCIKC